MQGGVLVLLVQRLLAAGAGTKEHDVTVFVPWFHPIVTLKVWQLKASVAPVASGQFPPQTPSVKRTGTLTSQFDGKAGMVPPDGAGPKNTGLDALKHIQSPVLRMLCAPWQVVPLP